MPVTNLKPDTEDAEDEIKLLANYNSKKKYRQVGSQLGGLAYALSVGTVQLSLSFVHCCMGTVWLPISFVLFNVQTFRLFVSN
jgi:hypothetical protein